MSETSQWQDLLADYFNLRLSEDDAIRWFVELELRFHDLDNDRLCYAIRWASDERNYRRDKMQGKPTVQELGKWVGICEWKNRQQNNAPVVCYLCSGSGWLPWAKELGDREDFTLEDYNCSITSCIPCLCSVGRNVFESNYGPSNKHGNKPVDPAAQKTIARQAAKQRQRYEKLRKEG